MDAMPIQRAFKEVRCLRSINIVANSKEAVKLLEGNNNERPGNTILDLNLPIMNGVEFLRMFKQDRILKHLPVVVFTSSKEQPDKLATYNLSITGYMGKPPSIKGSSKKFGTSTPNGHPMNCPTSVLSFAMEKN